MGDELSDEEDVPEVEAVPLDEVFDVDVLPAEEVPEPER